MEIAVEVSNTILNIRNLCFFFMMLYFFQEDAFFYIAHNDLLNTTSAKAVCELVRWRYF
jgi:hypothetical protein